VLLLLGGGGGGGDLIEVRFGRLLSSFAVEWVGE
jgi:hypothetical protein